MNAIVVALLAAVCGRRADTFPYLGAILLDVRISREQCSPGIR